MWKKPINSYDGTDFLPYHHDLQRLSRYHVDEYSSKEFLKDLTREKTHWLIRFLNVFLFGAMMIVEWIKKRFKNEYIRTEKT